MYIAPPREKTDQALSQVAILLTIFVVLTPANSFLPYLY